MKKLVIIILVVALTASCAAYVLLSRNNEKTTTQSVKYFSLNEVAAHATKDDCWTIINDNVYDITSYVPRHPGGDEILRACGVDGTQLFTQRKTDREATVGSGQPHSDSARDLLGKYRIGQLRT